MTNEIRDLDLQEVEAVAGGFDIIDDWCGTKPPRWPRPLLFDPRTIVINPIALIPGGG